MFVSSHPNVDPGINAAAIGRRYVGALDRMIGASSQRADAIALGGRLPSAYPRPAAGTVVGAALGTYLASEHGQSMIAKAAEAVIDLLVRGRGGIAPANGHAQLSLPLDRAQG